MDYWANSLDTGQTCQANSPGNLVSHQILACTLHMQHIVNVCLCIQVRSWCNIVYRKFNYSAYPSHVTKLGINYSFKPIIIKVGFIECSLVSLSGILMVKLKLTVKWRCRKRRENWIEKNDCCRNLLLNLPNSSRYLATVSNDGCNNYNWNVILEHNYIM